MPKVLVIDGADVCRAPIVEFTLRSAFAQSWLAEVSVVSRGFEARPEGRMCEVAADRIGLTSSSLAFYGTHRSRRLTREDLTGAELVLVAERAQRSAVLSLHPDRATRTFTWKEARVLATLVTERLSRTNDPRPADLETMCSLLHGSLGAIPVIEPPVRTAAFHWTKTRATDPLSISEGHDETRDLHRFVIDESRRTAVALAGLLVDLGNVERRNRPSDPARIDWPLRRA